MPRIVRSAKGDMVDFDALILKQQIAEAPMNIEVARRRDFIDSKEGRGRGQRQAAPLADQVVPVVEEVEFEIEEEQAPTKKKK